MTMNNSSNATSNFVFDCFRRYYKIRQVQVPDLPQREIAIQSFVKDSIMRRHLSYKNPEALQIALYSNPPAHLYYSVARYKNPDKHIMAEKQLQSAELVFDIDADHFASDKPYHEQLELAKIKVFELLDYLQTDFGLQKLIVVFSGSRGYHVHVYDESIQKMKSQERATLVDYLTMNDSEALLHTRKGVIRAYDTVTDKFIGFVERYILKLEIRDNTVSRKITELLMNKIKSWQEMGMKNAIEDMQRYGVLEATQCKTVWRILFEKDGNTKLTNDGITHTNIKQLEVIEKLFHAIISRDLSTQIDTQVTTDLHRLIRVPYSLHGKTGFVVTPVDIDELKAFNPLTDAIWDGFKTTTKRIIMTDDLTISMCDTQYNLRKGNEYDVPEYVALFVCCRQKGVLACT